jgi:glutamate-5-semialdehyde dehydrogenase
VIPYGRPTLVQKVVQLSTVPVLKSAMGNCYLYWSATGSLDMVRWVILDSHGSEPDPVNAIEKVLINRNQKPSSLMILWNSLKEKGFELRGDAELVAEFPDLLTLAADSEWNQPYLNKSIAFKVVDSIGNAIAWMNHYSSGHADCIVTESYQESRQFALGIDSSSVYVNSSPRFSRNPKRGDAVFLGISNQKGYRRGMINLETLTTLKQVVQGNGQF